MCYKWLRMKCQCTIIVQVLQDINQKSYIFILYQNSQVNGEGNGKIDIFKELTPHSWTYELRGQGIKKSIQNQNKQTPHTVLQKLSPKPRPWPLKGWCGEGGAKE